MGFKNKKSHRDKNHFDVISGVASCGYQVIDTAGQGGGFGDFIGCSTAAKVVIFEIKDPDGELMLSQLEFLANWRGYVGIVETAEQAIRILRDPASQAISERYKRSMMKLIIQRRQQYALDLRLKGKKLPINPRISVTAFNKGMAKLLGE
jgi:hypothetical protein